MKGNDLESCLNYLLQLCTLLTLIYTSLHLPTTVSHNTFNDIIYIFCTFLYHSIKVNIDCMAIKVKPS